MQFPGILRPLFGKALWKVKTSGKQIFLTFDDGPVPEVTPLVLDILDEKKWKATFFCVGENVAKFPELFEEILRRGHAVGNHCYNHLKGFQSSDEIYLANIEKADRLINSRLFRPPYGRIKPAQAKKVRNKYQLVMWDVITHDYLPGQNSVKIMKLLRSNLRKGSIVVFHDSVKAKENMLSALPNAIEYWKTMGYEYGLLN